MANQRAWDDRTKLMQYLRIIRGEIQGIISTNNEIKTLKAEILADTDRKNELIALLLEDPDFTISTLINKLNKIDLVATYLTDNPI